MSEYSLDEPGFKTPGALTPAPPSSDSSVEAPSDGRHKCVACPRRITKKTADRHTLCVNCRGFDCDVNTRCEECLEWPEEEVKLYSPLRHCLFVSPRGPSCAMSKNAVSFFLREVIHAAGASRPEVGSVRAHEIRSVSTSVASHRNWSVSSVLESATWSSSSVFSSSYLRDIQHEFDGMLSLGPFVAAGSRIG